MQVEQGTKHPEAGPWHKCTQMFTVVIGYTQNYQIRVIKLIRGSKILKFENLVLSPVECIYQSYISLIHIGQVVLRKMKILEISNVIQGSKSDNGQILQNESYLSLCLSWATSMTDSSGEL